MARKSTKHNTGAGTKFYAQDDTTKAQILGVESCTGFENISWGTEDIFDVESGKTTQKKTVQSINTYTMIVNDKLDAENLGLAILQAYAEEEGDAEQLYIIAEKDDGTTIAAKVCVSQYQPGDINNAIQKITITMTGNDTAVPTAPGGE